MAAAVPVLKVVAYAATAYSAYDSYRSGKEAAKDAKELAAYNAQMQKEESEETARRQKKADLEQEAQARARAAASGVKSSGSVTEYLDEMEEENKRNVNWILRSGKSQAYSTLRSGYNAANVAKAQGRAALPGVFTGLAGATETGYKFGQDMKWWK